MSWPIPAILKKEPSMNASLTRIALAIFAAPLLLTGLLFAQEAYRTEYNGLTGGYYHSTTGYGANQGGYYHSTTGYNSYTGGAAAGYNPYTGGYHAGSEDVNRATGTETESRTYHNPYTGTTAHVQESYNPYTGRRSVYGGAYRR
jgi:hypothetical protein